MMDLGDFRKKAGARLKQFIINEGISQGDFAEQIGVNSPTLSKVVTGGGGMSSEMVYNILQEYPQLRWDWVYKGTGEMLEGTTTTYQQGGVNQSGTEAVNVAYNSGNNNGNQYMNSGQGKIVVAETELQSCKDMLEEKDKMIAELKKDKERLENEKVVLREEKEVMRQEKDKFWKMLEKMMGE